ncbi:MAG: acetyl-CoA decarbonylase/synthase complex subunit delta [Oscillospiraceae bacterium]|nr:acetyl-CoA decarbonylase/synthase complex subunit delta [Oscillospiraceae bacterium]
MPFKKPVQKFNAAINEVAIGTGENEVKLGGQNCYPFYVFDSEIANAPKVGIEISDIEDVNKAAAGDFYDGCADVADAVKKAAAAEGVDFICIRLDGADPNGENRSVEQCVETVKKAAGVTDKPLVIAGCKNNEKDAQIFDKVSDALQGRNILVLSAREENYKNVAASAGLAYGQKVGAESAVDVNLAKQLNVLMNQMGVGAQSVIMNTGAAAAGYGFEYVISTLERVKGAALTQNDAMLQPPIITPVGNETWNVKEAMASDEDMPGWGDRIKRGVAMEIATAAACLAAGSDAVILKNPKSAAAVSAMIKELI